MQITVECLYYYYYYYYYYFKAIEQNEKLRTRLQRIHTESELSLATMTSPLQSQTAALIDSFNGLTTVSVLVWDHCLNNNQYITIMQDDSLFIWLIFFDVHSSFIFTNLLFSCKMVVYYLVSFLCAVSWFSLYIRHNIFIQMDVN